MQGLGIVLIPLIASLSTSCFGQQTTPKWNDLKVKWGPDPLDPTVFVSMPRTTADAVSQNFKKISDCDVNAQWRGARYVKNDDYAVVLLYDVNGYIAGIQTTVPKGQVPQYPTTKLQPPFVEDGNNWVVSAYFVDPAIICTTGRSADDFNNQGTGTDLFLQNSTTPEASIKVPINEADIGTTSWTEGNCFVTMGVHYWYNLRDDMSCDEVFPVFLMYNGGKLNSFGWAMMTDLTSPQFEHPAPANYPIFIKNVPPCLYNVGTTTTLHIYMTDNVAQNTC